MAKKKKRAGRASKKPARKTKKTAKRKTARKAAKPARRKSSPKRPASKKAKPAPLKAVAKPAGPKRYYITTAISYPNGAPHIGHAYEAICCDAIARFKRLDGYDVFFMTGVDEHGLKMTQTAAKEGISPKELSDRNSPRFREMCDRLNVSYDRFIRTSEPAHYKASQAIWKKMQEKGDIYLGTYAGWYSVRDEAFYAESETTVGPDGVRVGPQGTPVEWTEEKTYFFKLSAYAKKLLDLYKQKDFILPDTRKNEVVSFVKAGLQDLSISRTTLTWGVPVPDAPGHVMYVWVDALTNYITGLGYPDTNSEAFRKFWPADIHVIGKDIVRFHTVYWPAFLMSAGLEVPKRVHGHGFLFNRGEKMSKSVGNVVDPFSLADAYGVDALRYFFMREVPFGHDGNYSHDAIVNRINADLANNLGNLAQRSLSIIAKNCEAKVPQPGTLSAEDNAMLEAADGLIDGVRDAMQTEQLHKALELIWVVVADANRYFAAAAPWELRKTDPAKMATVLWTTAEVVRQIAILAQPFVPEGAGKLLDLLSVEANRRKFDHLGNAGRLKAGTPLPAPSGAFPRHVEPEEPKN